VAGSVASAGGGGLLNYDADMNVLSSTIFNNTSSVDGGGVENTYYGYAYLINATVYQNKATGNGGNLSNDPAGGGSTVVYAGNTILAGGTAASGADIWNLDTFTSYGYNLVQQSSNYGSGTSNSPQTGDLVGVNPGLASGLASNGGPTQTIADTSSSPGAGHIPFANNACGTQIGTNVDQRGYARGAGSVCDIGAYEFNGVPGNGTPNLPASIKRRP
ncbi:MAG: choice-of-anchor Q domain-containing protein, partial [Vulcanimicrobiaceae bacterium]